MRLGDLVFFELARYHLLDLVLEAEGNLGDFFWLDGRCG